MSTTLLAPHGMNLIVSEVHFLKVPRYITWKVLAKKECTPNMEVVAVHVYVKRQQ